MKRKKELAVTGRGHMENAVVKKYICVGICTLKHWLYTNTSLLNWPFFLGEDDKFQREGINFGRTSNSAIMSEEWFASPIYFGS